MRRKVGQITEKMAFISHPPARNLKTALIYLNPAKGFVKGGDLSVAGHGQDDEVAPALGKPKPGGGGNEAAPDLPAMKGLENIDSKDFAVGLLGRVFPGLPT